MNNLLIIFWWDLFFINELYKTVLLLIYVFYLHERRYELPTSI